MDINDLKRGMVFKYGRPDNSGISFIGTIVIRDCNAYSVHYSFIENGVAVGLVRVEGAESFLKRVNSDRPELVLTNDYYLF